MHIIMSCQSIYPKNTSWYLNASFYDENSVVLIVGEAKHVKQSNDDWEMDKSTSYKFPQKPNVSYLILAF